MKLKELDKYYTFHLTSHIDVCKLDKDPSLSVCRCTVFPKFFMTYEELVENVFGVDNATRKRFRGQFKSFLKDLQCSHSIYANDKRTDTITEVSEITTNLVIDLTEKCAVNLFIPDLRVIMIGHDDFGFIFVTDIKNPDMSYISDKLEQYVLYFVKPEKL